MIAGLRHLGFSAFKVGLYSASDGPCHMPRAELVISNLISTLASNSPADWNANGKESTPAPMALLHNVNTEAQLLAPPTERYAGVSSRCSAGPLPPSCEDTINFAILPVALVMSRFSVAVRSGELETFEASIAANPSDLGLKEERKSVSPKGVGLYWEELSKFKIGNVGRRK